MSGVQDAIRGVQDIRLSQSCTLSATMLVLFDWALTFNDEVEYIWARQWTTVKIAFITIRYGGLTVMTFQAFVTIIGGLSTELCRKFYEGQTWSEIILAWMVQCVLQFRIYGMYGGSKSILATMLFFFVIETVALVVLANMQMTKLIVASERLGSLEFCAYEHPQTFMKLFCIPYMLFEGMLFGLALYKGYVHFCAKRVAGPNHFNNAGTKHIWQWQNSETGELLLAVLVQDSISYFFFTFVTYVVNTGLWLAMPPVWIEISQGFTMAMMLIMGTRMLLRMRKVFYTASNQQLRRFSAVDMVPVEMTTWIMPENTPSQILDQSTLLDPRQSSTAMIEHNL